MKLTKIVEIYNDEPRAGTFVIAKGLDRNHKNLITTIERNREDFEVLGDLKTLKSKSTGGRPAREYLLNKSHCLLLLGFMRSNVNNNRFIVLLIKEFNQTGKNLKEILQAFENFDFDNINVRYVYAARDSQGCLKIGISNNPERRLKEINANNADNLKLVYVKKALNPRYKDETILHNTASDYRIKGEWFMPEAKQFLELKEAENAN